MVIVEESAREADETKEAMEAREQQPGDPEKFTSLADSSEKSGLGSISFVSCATGADAIEQPPSLVSETEEEAKPRLTKETAVELGRSPLHRRLDVYKLEPEQSPLDPLPFISHTTNKISR